MGLFSVCLTCGHRKTTHDMRSFGSIGACGKQDCGCKSYRYIGV